MVNFDIHSIGCSLETEEFKNIIDFNMAADILTIVTSTASKGLIFEHFCDFFWFFSKAFLKHGENELVQ